MQADMVVYGKTVAGGLPIGVVCGRRELMRRFDPRAADAARVRRRHLLGASGGHGCDVRIPASGSRRRTERQQYAGHESAVRGVGALDERSSSPMTRCPLRVVHLGTIWTVLFREPGRYNWLLQYYLRAQGVTLSWVGTGRCLVEHGLHGAGLHDDCSARSSVPRIADANVTAGGWTHRNIRKRRSA